LFFLSYVYDSSQPDLEYKILDEIRRIHEIIKKSGEQGDFGMQMKYGQLLHVCYILRIYS